MKLVDRYPNTPRVSLLSDATEAEACAALADYLDWRLVQLDTVTIDLLLQSPDSQQVVLLVGTAANAWLRLHGTGG